MSLKMVCDMCGVELPEHVQYYNLSNENASRTLSNNYPDKQFCNALCLATYAAQMCGRTISS